MAANELTIKINGKVKDYLDKLKEVESKTGALTRVTKDVTKRSAIAFTGLSAAIGLTTNEFSKYETALVGVGKTTDISGKNLDRFGKEFKKLSQEIPVATNDLLGIAQAAGQLGVSGEKNLLKFTETVAKLGVATDLSGEEAATALTRILNVTGEGIDTIDTFGSVIVALGNNFAATESEITRMTTEITRATSVFGVSSAEAAALGTAMRAVGIRAELGGSAIGRTFRAIDETVRKGGPQLQNLAKIAGVTGDKFVKTFQNDSTKAFQLFVEGLGRLTEEGGSASQALEQFGLSGDEINKVLPVIAKESGIFADALKIANKETKNATALNKEAAKAFDTLESEKRKTWNTVINLASGIGEELAPTVIEILQTVRDFAKAIASADGELVETIASFLKWGAAITGTVAAIGGYLLAAAKISAIITAISSAFGIGAVAAGGFWAAVTGPIGIAIAGIAAVTAGAAALYNALDSDTPETLGEVNSQLNNINKQISAITEKDYKSASEIYDLDKLNEQKRALEKLREEKTKLTEDFGTGSLLVRPEPQTGPELGPEAFGLPAQQEIPLVASQQEEIKEKVKKSQEDTTEIISSEVLNRINLLRDEAASIREINKARNQGLLDSDLEYLRRKNEINKEFAEARLIENEQERNAAIELLNAKHKDELAEIEKFEKNKQDIIDQRKEERSILDSEFKELEKEQQAMFNEQELEALQEQIETKKEIEKNFALERLQAKINENNLFLEEEKRYGKTFAKISSFFRKEEVQGAKKGAAELIQLTRSKNETLKGIGKAAASTQAAIATAEGAIQAYRSLSGIPIVGPALGAAAAAALTAYGVERQSEILAANTGGFVPTSMGIRGKDSVSAALTPGEFVVPEKNADQVIDAMANERVREEEGTGLGESIIRFVLEPAGDFVGMIEQQIVERRMQGRSII